MKIEILMSTMNRQNINDLKLEEKNIYDNCLIINQITQDGLKIVNQEIKDKNIRMLSFKEKGLAKSRNRALENSKGDICLIADDDILYKKDYEETILTAFSELSNSQIITFNYERFNLGIKRKFTPRIFNHSLMSIRKVCSIEIAFDRKEILEKGIKFDEEFGLGSTYNSGEERIFLSDSIKNSLRVSYFPKVINLHPDIASGTKLTLESLESKGPLFYRLFGFFSYFYLILFLIIKYPKYKCKKVNIIKILYNCYSELINYNFRGIKNEK